MTKRPDIHGDWQDWIDYANALEEQLKVVGEQAKALREALRKVERRLPPNDDPYDGTANTVIGPIVRTALAGEEAS